jgi:hypothetical protein
LFFGRVGTGPTLAWLGSNSTCETGSHKNTRKERINDDLLGEQRFVPSHSTRIQP